MCIHAIEANSQTRLGYLFRVPCFVFRVQSFGFQVVGSRFRVPSAGFRVQPISSSSQARLHSVFRFSSSGSKKRLHRSNV